MAQLKTELVSFFRLHWPHLLIAIPAALLITVLHEFAHAAAVLAQGGEVLEFSMLPSESEWGHVEFKFPSDADFSPALIALAPYGAALAVCAMAGLLGLKPGGYAPWLASSIFVWFYVAPLGEVGNAAIPYLFGEQNDLAEPLGRPGMLEWMGTVALALAGSVFGYPLQRRLYGTRAISLRTYAVLCSVTLAGFVAVIGWA
jgi:hypothetical protein